MGSGYPSRQVYCGTWILALKLMTVSIQRALPTLEAPGIKLPYYGQ